MYQYSLPFNASSLTSSVSMSGSHHLNHCYFFKKNFRYSPFNCQINFAFLPTSSFITPLPLFLGILSDIVTNYIEFRRKKSLKEIKKNFLYIIMYIFAFIYFIKYEVYLNLFLPN